MNKLNGLIIECLEYYIEIAKKNYKNLSSFAIITTEDFEPFDFAINTNYFFKGIKETCEEQYWNTAEWVEEILSSKYPNSKIEELNKLLSDNLYKPNFLKICKNALKTVRTKTDNRICLFVHCTNFETSEELRNIVKELNTEEIYQFYKNYHTE